MTHIVDAPSDHDALARAIDPYRFSETELSEMFKVFREEALAGEQVKGMEILAMEEDQVTRYGEEFIVTVERLYVSYKQMFEYFVPRYMSLINRASMLHSCNTVELYFRMSLDSRSRSDLYILFDRGLMFTLFSCLELCEAEFPIISTDDTGRFEISIKTRFGENSIVWDKDYDAYWRCLLPKDANGFESEIFCIILYLMDYYFGKKTVLEVLEKRKNDGIDFNFFTLFQFLKVWRTNEEVRDHPTDWVILSGMLEDTRFIRYGKSKVEKDNKK